MNRKEFRRTRVVAWRDLMSASMACYELAGTDEAHRLFYEIGTQTDVLTARQSRFTPNARARIAVYPLIKR